MRAAYLYKMADAAKAYQMGEQIRREDSKTTVLYRKNYPAGTEQVWLAAIIDAAILGDHRIIIIQDGPLDIRVTRALEARGFKII